MPRHRDQKGSLIELAGGRWSLQWVVYTRDPVTGKEKREHRSKILEKTPRYKAQKILNRLPPNDEPTAPPPAGGGGAITLGSADGSEIYVDRNMKL